VRGSDIDFPDGVADNFANQSTITQIEGQGYTHVEQVA
jgi:hypothetical protein